jgi:flavin reductase (DIM6/NTAB) family NADH-FMN oxidoreductase RutF
MIIDPSSVPYRDCYKLMIGSIVPRPIALVSTLAVDGHANLAPFSYFTAIASDPPTLCFSPGRRFADAQRKDTLANIEARREFVVNVVTESMVAAMNETATDYPPDVNEFEVAGFTPLPSHRVAPPRVKESPIHMECRLYDIVHINIDRPGGGSLVIGEIVLFHVDDGVYEEGRINFQKLNPLGRLAGDYYTTLGRLIALKRKTYPPK